MCHSGGRGCARDQQVAVDGVVSTGGCTPWAGRGFVISSPEALNYDATCRSWPCTTDYLSRRTRYSQTNSPRVSLGATFWCLDEKMLPGTAKSNPETLYSYLSPIQLRTNPALPAVAQPRKQVSGLTVLFLLHVLLPFLIAQRGQAVDSGMTRGPGPVLSAPWP